MEEYINNNPKSSFDMILLDRDCKLGGSFHTADLERLGPEKVIAISSVPKYNEEAKARGVLHVVEKDYKNLEVFADNLRVVVEKFIREMKPKDSDYHQIA